MIKTAVVSKRSDSSATTKVSMEPKATSRKGLNPDRIRNEKEIIKATFSTMVGGATRCKMDSIGSVVRVLYW